MHKKFRFQYPVTIRTSKGPVCLDTLTVIASANLYGDGSARTVDIEEVMDGEGHIITKWMPFIECMDGDLNKAIEAAAMERANDSESLFEAVAASIKPIDIPVRMPNASLYQPLK